ncbi:phosphatidylinositol kinase- protein kinase tor1 [Phytophthora pseudosyringae]|uniref:non-specific serine/threonine protein kinase n=1 Tax=Phytophthora pseudosyringae TaxID=221518 RepID=A0A8T1W3J3_9STRA|nr:phosphatidylinositol kinase- protein kinase tor1 [Phytophthora pseudosyringae]
MQFQDREHVEALLASLVQRLDAPEAAARHARVSELYAAVASLSRQLSAERFAKALGQLTPQLYKLLQRGSSESAQLGALLAIERLIDVSNEDQFIRFVNYLRYFLQQPQPSTRALLAAASAMGKLAASSVSGTLVASFVDFEAKRAFEWLQEGQPGTHAARNEALVSQRRLAACFVLRELAQAAPTLFHVNLTTFFQSIWGAVRDQRVEIREAATSALAACLQLITRRQTRHRVQWYCKVYDQVFEGLALRPSAGSGVGATTASSPPPTSNGQTALASWECAHGSLLVIGELLANTGRFMVPRFREVCDTVLRYKDAKERLVSRAVSRLLPQLAEFCPGAFVQYYLDVCVAHLTKRILEYSAPPSERGVAFLAMGRLSLAVGDALLPHLPPILKLVKESLAPHTVSKRKRTRNKLFCVQTLTCVANMSRALGPRFEPFLFRDGVLETMMIGGLSDELIDSLAEVVASVPSALPYVQERLLNEISGILRGTPFSLGSGGGAAYPPGSSGGAGSSANGDGGELALDASYYDTATDAPAAKQTAVQALFSSMKRGFSSVEDDPACGSGSLMIKGETGDEIDTILLSLRTLSCFNFSGSFCLLPFVRDCVALYLKNPDARIREQAVITCSKLLLPSPESPDTALMSSWRHVKKRGPSGRVIDLVLTQLLQVGISDMDGAVRRSVVESLDARFDELLSQETHLKLVFLLLNDENANIRERAMQLLERLAPRNPSFVMPSLRRVIIQLVTELQHTSDLRMREDSTRLLGHLIRAAQHLVDPYVVRILEVLLPILVRGNAPLTMAVLVTLGELALVSRTQIAAYERYLFPLIIHTLQDHSSIEKRQVALQTLGQLAGSTGCVVRPYLASPKLLEIFLSLLHHNVGTPWSLRREAMRTIGILGALDPYKYKLCISRASLRQANEVASTTDTSTASEEEEKNADTAPLGVSKSVAGTMASQYPILDIDLKALGVTINLASFDRKATSDALDEKQQIELQLFTAAPIGTRKIDSGSAAGTLLVGSQSSHPVSGAAGVSAGALTSSLSSSSRKKRQVGSIGMSLSDDSFDFESSLMDSELELDPTELSPASEAYFPTVAIHALLRILREPSLNVHHHGVIQAIMFIFKSLSTQCVPFLKYILPPFLRVLSRGEPRLRESLFLQLTTLISIVNAHMKPFFPPIMVLALRFWGSHLPQIVRLVEKISQAAPHEFRTQYFPKLLPKLLEVLQPHFGLSGAATDGELSGASTGVSGAAAITQGSGDGVSGVGGSGDHHGQAHGSISGGNSDHVSSTYDIVQNGGADGSTAVAVAAIQVQVVQSLIVFGDAVEDYVYLLVPALVHLMESLDTPLEVKITTVYALARICVVANFEQYAGPRLLQPLARVASQVSAKGPFFFSRSSSNAASTGSGASNVAGSSGSGSAGAAAARIATSKSEATRFSEVMLYALGALVFQLQAEVLSFEPLLQQIIASLPFSHRGNLATAANVAEGSSPSSSPQAMVQRIAQALENLRCGARVPRAFLNDPVFMTPTLRKFATELQAQTAASMTPVPSLPTNVRLHVNQQNLRRAWEASQRSTKEDWLEWMRRFSIELLRESPSAALRSCCALAQAYNPLARALFNPAFVSCWNELYEQYQDYLVRALETAFQSDTIPAEILQTLLNLAEFMEHDVEALPIDIRELGELAQKCHAYAKALHYKELEFHTSPSTCIEALISINNQLGQPEAAVGILKYAQAHHSRVIQVKETWFEKLQDWNAALALYDRRLQYAQQHGGEDQGLHIEVCIGKMRCLEALGKWEELSALASQVWAALRSPERSSSKTSAPSSRGRPLSAGRAPSSTSGVGSGRGNPGLLRRGSNSYGSSSSLASAGGPPPSSSYQFGDDRGDEAAALRRVAMLGARASWCLSQWDSMTQYVTECAAQNDTSNANSAVISRAANGNGHGYGYGHTHGHGLFGADEDVTELSLYQSVLAVHQNNFEQAANLIDATRKTLDTKLGALVGESYSRAYRSMVTLQQLSELEEVVTYKKLRAQISKGEEAARYKRHLMRMWRDRLSGCKRVVEVWQQLVVVRALILSPHEDIDSYLQFASLCRQSGNLSLSLKVFTNALHVHGGAGSNGTGISEMLSVAPSSSGAAPSFGFGEKDRNRVAFAYLKHLWAAGQKQEALTDLHRLVVRISTMARHRSQVPGGMGGMPSPAPAMMPIRSDEEELLVKCHLKMAEWQLAVHDQQIEHVPVESVLSSLRLCTELEPRSYKAWHAWALMNFQVVEHSTHSQHISANATASAVAASASVTPYIAPAIEGFFRSVALGRSRWAANVQQDILRVLTLWFAHGHRTDVHAALEKGFRSVSIETWLIVIPQLIARIHTPYPRIQKQLHRLLVAVGKQHPHALIYPLSVALKSSVTERQQAADAIMSTMRTNYVELVDEALLVSRELIRVAILWHEMWHEGLEEASRLYFGEHNVDGMAEVLRPLHAMMERGPETLREVSFHGAFGRDLREANEWLQRFLSNRRNESDLNRAWDLYYHVFRRINKQLPQITTLELQVVSPNLLSARNLQLAVPGTYRAGHAIVKIGSFLPTVAVITSKQRPRRITIVGSNGLEYMFLLKGHEDLRQDERVTQLFGLVNALLINDRNTSKKDLKIHRYPVIPLSDNAGIVGWVPHCDTLHQLIRDYREARKILLNIEHRLMLQMAPDYDALTLLEKVEVFQYALENTAGQDLYKVLWLKSENSEVWLDRRTNYTRSLAVMSMVGYILGLGDRHPSNFMLHRFTGTIVHIDFGDCFEVAMDREKYPEKIPFRLTRMLTNAMEVSGIEGNFRFSCESVMAVLRENRHSLMAMLEAFVHDPLINWRLLSATNVQPSSRASSSVASSVVSSSIVSSAMSMDSESDYESSEASSHGPSETSSHGPSEPSTHGPGDEELPHRRSESISIPDPTPSSTATLLDDRDEPRPTAGKAQDTQGQESESKDEREDKKQETNGSCAAAEEENKTSGSADADAGAQAEEAPASERQLPPRTKPPVSRQVSASLAAPRQLPPRPGLKEAEAAPPPLPSSLSSRPMSLSKSIPLPMRKLPPRAPPANRVHEDAIDENEESNIVEKIDYTTMNLHAEISSLAASVSSVGHSSLSRSFSVTQAQIQAQSRATEEQQQMRRQQGENGQAAPVERQSVAPSTPLGPPPRMAPTASTSFVSVTAAAQIPPSSDAVPPSVGTSDLHANRSVRERELLSALGPEGIAAPRVALNEKAVAVIRRVQAKLSGRDFEGDGGEPLDVSAQVQRLISQATSHENLCQCYIGWCPFW